MTQQALDHSAGNTQSAPRPLASNSGAKMKNVVPPAAPKGHHHWAMLVVIILLLIIAAAVAWFLTYGGRYQSTNDAYTDGRAFVPPLILNAYN
jgi:hypothetical protein